MIGLDCDRPRGRIVQTTEGREMAYVKLLSLERIGRKLNRLEIPRTYFVCGEFLESMVSQFGETRIREAFSPENSLSEIADHTYSHNVMKAIPTRPDKIPARRERVQEEYSLNTELFTTIFQMDLSHRGLRTPLGHYQGISSETELIASLEACGVTYVSSDLRDENHSLNPPLVDSLGNRRQPYRLTENLVEVPSHGWQDTAFGGRTSTRLFEPAPSSYGEILDYYLALFEQARTLASISDNDFYLGLVNHPYNICSYDPLDRLFDDLIEFAGKLGVQFCHYRSARDSVVSVSIEPREFEISRQPT